MDRTLLAIQMWVLFLGGLVGGAMGMTKFFTGGTPVEYGVMGIGGGIWLVGAAITIYFRKQVKA